jgi:hypothetical protein
MKVVKPVKDDQIEPCGKAAAAPDLGRHTREGAHLSGPTTVGKTTPVPTSKNKGLKRF